VSEGGGCQDTTILVEVILWIVTFKGGDDGPETVDKVLLYGL